MEKLGTLGFPAVSTYFFLVNICIPPKSDMFDQQQSNKQGAICAGDQNGGQLPDMIAFVEEGRRHYICYTYLFIQNHRLSNSWC